MVGTAEWEQWPVARAVGNYRPYATTLYDYVRKAMPQLTPGVLTEDETYAVIAYILNLNGLVPDDAVMDATTLPAVEMPARDRFVADDRRAGRRFAKTAVRPDVGHRRERSSLLVADQLDRSYHTSIPPESPASPDCASEGP